MSELVRKIGILALHGDDHLEDIQEFLGSIRMAEAQLKKILEKQSSAAAKNALQSRPSSCGVSTRRDQTACSWLLTPSSSLLPVL